MVIQIRAFHPADTDAIMALLHDTIHAVNIRDYDAAQVAAWAPAEMDRATWLGSLVAHTTAVAVDDGRIVGFTDWEPNGHLDRFYVHKDYQGVGVGKALLRAVEDDARQQGVARFFVEASITARPFFEHHGYRTLAEQQVEVRGQVFTNYRMEKML